jgi:hypothetical protein
MMQAMSIMLRQLTGGALSESTALIAAHHIMQEALAHAVHLGHTALLFLCFWSMHCHAWSWFGRK